MRNNNSRHRPDENIPLIYLRGAVDPVFQTAVYVEYKLERPEHFVRSTRNVEY